MVRVLSLRCTQCAPQGSSSRHLARFSNQLVLVKSDIFHVSIESWSGLLAQGRASHHVRSNKIARGLSAYIANCSRVGLLDTRPDYVRDTDLERLTAELLPYWLPDHYPRLHRRLSLDAATRRRLIVIARMYGVANYRSDSLRRGNSMISAILEALGSGWLTPARGVDVVVRGTAHKSGRQHSRAD